MRTDPQFDSDLAALRECVREHMRFADSTFTVPRAALNRIRTLERRVAELEPIAALEYRVASPPDLLSEPTPAEVNAALKELERV